MFTDPPKTPNLKPNRFSIQPHNISLPYISIFSYHLAKGPKCFLPSDILTTVFLYDLSFPLRSQDSSVGIATGYGQDDQGQREFES
jgi:hypothetical protein